MTLCDKRDELSEVLSLISDAARDLIAQKYGAKAIPLFYTSEQEARRIASRIPADALFSVAGAADKTRTELQFNTNIYTALTAFAAAI